VTELISHYLEEILMNRSAPERTRIKQLLYTAFFSAMTLVLLGGCMPAALVGGGVAGTVVALDRRTVGTQTEDTTLGFRGESIARSIVGSQGRVSVNSYNRIILMTGEVPDEGMKIRVESEIAKLPNVRKIVNELEIMPVSTLRSRTNDSMLSAKVSASFLEASDVYYSSIKAVTTRGHVYLMGLVTEREGNRAAEVASSIPGVVRVSKVFEHISEHELEQIQAQRAPDPPPPAPHTYQNPNHYQ
jgi:osmotically-inducible protein OsmY